MTKTASGTRNAAITPSTTSTTYVTPSPAPTAEVPTLRTYLVVEGLNQTTLSIPRIATTFRTSVACYLGMNSSDVTLTDLTDLETGDVIYFQENSLVNAEWRECTYDGPGDPNELQLTMVVTSAPVPQGAVSYARRLGQGFGIASGAYWPLPGPLTGTARTVALEVLAQMAEAHEQGWPVLEDYADQAEAIVAAADERAAIRRRRLQLAPEDYTQLYNRSVGYVLRTAVGLQYRFPLRAGGQVAAEVATDLVNATNGLTSSFVANHWLEEILREPTAEDFASIEPESASRTPTSTLTRSGTRTAVPSQTPSSSAKASVTRALCPPYALGVKK